jgi:hypothetical protein
MAPALKRAAKRRGARRARRAVSRVAAGTPETVAEAPFDEPATPPRKPNPSIEEPTTSGMLAGETEEACGLPDRAKTPPSDLH